MVKAITLIPYVACKFQILNPKNKIQLALTLCYKSREKQAAAFENNKMVVANQTLRVHLTFVLNQPRELSQVLRRVNELDLSRHREASFLPHPFEAIDRSCVGRGGACW